jgi:hypothetical protein
MDAKNQSLAGQPPAFNQSELQYRTSSAGFAGECFTSRLGMNEEGLY